ncbi:MAG: serine/threonine-protein kinase [Acidobacteria bacterium]|nr:serine/threonine-protein kinase [Acidobacteriota bacterium]
MIGDTLGPYRVLEKLGAGGMGVVYRAEDTQLKRAVALKFLPSDPAVDEEAEQRFLVEAQAASALDHPNICTIHAIDRTTDGRPFLVMALYEGETLAAKIRRGPLSVDEAIDYAAQAGEGLAKAHAAGIVHRDIKPANLFVTRDGIVKILDFGIAKLADGTAITRTGSMLGTLAYMSPEQLAGRTADARSDVWSLGVVLYEMLCGHRPFGGDQPQTVVLAVASEPLRPVTEVRPSVPDELARVVARALAKPPGDRFQSMEDLVSALQSVPRAAGHGAATVTNSSARAVRPAASSRRPALWGAVAAAALAFVTTGVYLYRPPAPADESTVLRLSNPAQVAQSVGIEMLPSWSPDGRTIAYHSDQAGNNDIWIAQVGGGAPVNRTSDFTGADEAPRISPDGTQIAFWSAREGGGLYVMPLIGGSARKVAPARADVAAPAAWSPSGRELAYILPPAVSGDEPAIDILDPASGVERRVELPARLGAPRFCLDMAWSPDGQLLACVQANSYNNQESRLWVVRLSDQTLREISQRPAISWSPAWSPDSRALFYTSNRGGPMDVWRQALSDAGEPIGPPDRLTTGLDAQHITLTRDGRRLAYAKGRRVANVWRVPGDLRRPASWADAVQVTLDQAYIESFDVSPDGQRLAIQSDRGGNNLDIWVLPASGGELQRFTADPAHEWWPAWSPDSQAVAFYSNRGGTREVWVQAASGGPARQLTTQGGSFPKWRPGGRELLYSDRGGVGLWVVPAEGGGQERILAERTFKGFSTRDVSVARADGALAFAAGLPPNRRVWRSGPNGENPQVLTRDQATAPAWSADGRRVYFTTYREVPGATYQLERPGLNIWRVSRDGTREEPVTALAGRRGFIGFTIAHDGKFLYFTWREDVSDIWMMDVEGGAGTPR